jgi:Ca-activated chloride channel family protein
MPETPNYYSLLGLPFDSTEEEIRNAYREIVRQVHPDTSRTPGTTERFIQVQKAYEVLSNPDLRSRYDLTLPAALTKPPILLSTMFSRSSLQRTPDPQLLYVLLELSANIDNTKYTSPPLNVCLVIDRSTSMQGIVMDTVKNTAIEVIRHLRPEDVISVVSFSDKADVIVPAGSNQERAKIENNIYMLHPGGGTEIFKGLEKGFAEVRRFRNPKAINHIILITDGRTYGDETTCESLADQAAQLKIGISCLGIGGKWNDPFLDRLSTKTGGSTMYISKPKDVDLFLKEKFRSLGDCYADRTFLKYDLDPKVELRCALRLQPETNMLEITSPMHLGAIHQGTPLGVMLEMYVHPITTGISSFNLLKGRIFFDIPNRAGFQFSTRLDISRPTSNDPDPMSPPPSIVHAISQLTLYRMQERARADVAKGKIQDATRRLQYLASNLLSQGQGDLAGTVLREAANIQQNLAFSEDGEKRIKYGTRALLLPPSKEEKRS